MSNDRRVLKHPWYVDKGVGTHCPQSRVRGLCRHRETPCKVQTGEALRPFVLIKIICKNGTQNKS